ncbi:hypothetical protein [Haliangium ochraceum]|nr:hypothetical protein [Haliangium ochraceum]
MQQAAETLATDDRAGQLRGLNWLDDPAVDALMVTLGVVVGGEF